MSRSYVTLAEHPTDTVRLACIKCGHRGQYRKATPIERYEPDKNLVDLSTWLVCPARQGLCSSISAHNAHQ
jgi:hypothetical protein